MPTSHSLTIKKFQDFSGTFQVLKNSEKKSTTFPGFPGGMGTPVNVH